MKSYLSLIQQKFIFFSFFLLYVIISLTITFNDTKINCFIRLNALHFKGLDNFFIVITYLGDGFLSIVFALLVIFVGRKYRLGIQLLLAYLISGLVAQLIKHFTLAPRPMTILNNVTYHCFIDGITHSGWNSFPSGHTTSIFAMVTILILFLKSSTASFLLLLVAILVGYSRIYLGQHFLEDVIAGSLIGVITGYFTYCFTYKKQWPLSRFGVKWSQPS